MSQRDQACAVIVDGGLGGLAAAWSAAAAHGGAGESPLLISCAPTPERFQARKRAIEKLVDLCAPRHVIQLSLPEPCGALLVNEPVADAAARRSLSHLLLDACAEAMKLDISRLVWPVIPGAPSEAELRTEAIADACDRSLLVGQLASLEAPRTGPGSRGVRLETPYADLTDVQLAELVIDLGAPLAAASWCQAEGNERGRGCGSCHACRRWSAALKRAGARIPV